MRDDSTALICHQCNGWNGHYKPGKTSVSTCDNRNNQCASPKFCVKIVDPIDPEYHYITYKADCWFENTILTNATITQTIDNKACYSWSDGGIPAKT
uniref:Uncharacterized protein n=1 Tax=Panagrolaimus davidi TaxID=227884 RepID=A0A914QCJ7_9BILA